MRLFEEIIREADKSRFLKPLYDEFSKQYAAIPEYKSLLKFVNSDDPLLRGIDWQIAISKKTDISEKNYLFDFIIESFNDRLEKRSIQIDKKRAHAAGSIIDMAKAEGFKVVSGGDSSDCTGFVHLKNLENDEFTFLVPMSWEASIFCDSSLAGGEGAKWCIGYEQSSGYWDDYIADENLFIMAFNKKAYKDKNRKPDTLKYMIVLCPEYRHSCAWKQTNELSETISVENFGQLFGWSAIDMAEEFKNAVLVDSNVYSGCFLDDFDYDEDVDDYRPSSW